MQQGISRETQLRRYEIGPRRSQGKTTNRIHKGVHTHTDPDLIRSGKQQPNLGGDRRERGRHQGGRKMQANTGQELRDSPHP